MSKIELTPYIFFKGDCSKAMEFYEKVFGGKLDLMKYEDVPGDFPGKDQMKGKVMNSSLETDDFIIRASDTQKASEAAKKVSICLTGSDEAKLRKIFEGLSEDVVVAFPLKKEFWGDIFGQVTDKFNVDWMIDITPAK
jgi:PhnB protein